MPSPFYVLCKMNPYNGTSPPILCVKGPVHKERA